MKTYSAYRKDARQALAEKWGESAAASLLLLLFQIIMLLPLITMSIYENHFTASVIIVGGLSLILYVLYVPLLFGYNTTFLHKAKGDDTTAINDMFCSWKNNFGSAWGFWFLKEVIVCAFALALIIVFCILFIIFVVTGVVSLEALIDIDATEPMTHAALIATGFILLLYMLIYTCLYIFSFIIEYMYSMTYYIQEEHPDWAFDKCMRESRLLMKGKKWKLFVLDLTFIGWVLLSILTFGIGLFWLLPYMLTTRACFYKDITSETAEEPTLCLETAE